MGLTLKKDLAIDGIYKKNNSDRYVNVKTIDVNLENNTITFVINYYISKADRLSGAYPEETRVVTENLKDPVKNLTQSILIEIYSLLKSSDEFSEKFIDS